MAINFVLEFSCDSKSPSKVWHGIVKDIADFCITQKIDMKGFKVHKE